MNPASRFPVAKPAVPRVQVTLERQHNGSLLAYAVYNNRLIRQVYMGYTMKQARAAFIEDLAEAAYAIR